MNTRLLALVVLTALLSGGGFAAEVLVKRIPGDEHFSEAVGSLFGQAAHRWNPGFRMASTNEATFVAGWTGGTGGADDGFVARLDPAGAISWTKTMSQITGTFDNWQINDIEVLSDHLFVCGKRIAGTSQRAFIAKLTLEGTLVDNSMVEGFNGWSRGSALAVGDDGQGKIITMVGDASGDRLRVIQREKNGAAIVFDGLHLCNTDAFVVNFDEDLRAVWGTTLGNDVEGSQYATAVAADNTGAIFVAIIANAASNTSDEHTRSVFRGNHFGDRKAFYVDSGGAEFERALGVAHTSTAYPNDAYGNDFDPYNGDFSIIYRIDPLRAHVDPQGGHWQGKEITHHFFPCRLESGENNSENRIADLVYSNGSLFVTGEWKQNLRPASSESGASHNILSKPSGYDIWVTKLSAGNLTPSNWRIYGSTGQDYAASLTVGGDNSVYLSGVAGGSLKTRTLAIATESDPSGPLASNSSKAHVFWQKLSTGDLSPVANWHVTPVEDNTNGIVPPNGQRTASIGIVGETVVIAGTWNDGDLAMGPDVARRKTLSNASTSEWSGFVGFLNKDGSFLEEVEIIINSEYGAPTPHGGKKGTPQARNTVAAGNSITASVPQVVYEDAAGNILDAADSDAIRDRAVTRRICTGYQFRSSTQNGTANTVTFVASGDTELTFLWRIEHAIQIDADVASADGLTSKSAGDPEPEVNKHWIVEGESFVASINGKEIDPAEVGTRWRSLGYIAEGSAAQAAGISSGNWIRWGDLQNRQQTPEIIVNSPGKITWQWQKEHSVRVAVNSSVAADAPTFSWQHAPGIFAGLTTGDFNTFEYIAFAAPVTRDTLIIQFNEGSPPGFIQISSGNTLGDWKSETVAVPAGTVAGDSITLRFPPLAGVSFRMTGVDAIEGGNPVSNASNSWALWSGAERTGTGEFWAPAGVDVTLSSAATVDSGISTLDLKGYNTGQGMVTPSAASGVTSKLVALNEPSAITWDYARAIYDEAVELGGFLTFSGVTGLDAGRINQNLAPLAGNVSVGPTGSGFGDMQIWDQVEGRLLALQPGTFTAEFRNTDAPDDPAQNIIVRLTVDWPSEVDYTHIIETPPVPLDPSGTDGTAFVRLAHSDSIGSVGADGFSAVEPGRSVLLFSQRADGEANGDLKRESLSVKVVNSINWQTSAGGGLAPATIGEHLSSGDHDASIVGHNGHVVQGLAPVNAGVYDPTTKVGPIIPVNEVAATEPGLIAHFPLTEQGGNSTYERVSQTSAVLSTTYSSGVAKWAKPGVNIYHTDSDHFKSDPAVGNEITNQLTLAAWIEPDSFPDWAGIVTKGENAAPYTMTLSSAGKLRFAANVFTVGGTGGGPASPWDSNATLIANKFYHVAVTYDGTDLRMYIDGVLDRTEVVALTFDSSTEPLVIGADLPGGDEFFDGVIRDVRVYDRALNGSEIAALHSPMPEPEKDLTVAWYEVNDGIRWPYKAVGYDPRWPAQPGRIVVASQLGSEGLSSAPTVDDAGGAYAFTINVGGDSPSWSRPSDDRVNVEPALVNYEVVAFVPDNLSPAWVTATWSPSVFVYENDFDPSTPLENLLTLDTDVSGSWVNHGLLSAGQLYYIVVSQGAPGDPTGGALIDPDQGLTRYSFQPNGAGFSYADPVLYSQPDPAGMGYNPNEEHALVAPSFLDPSRQAAFALRNDLNQPGTSRPYVLVQYEDRSSPGNPEVKMKVYSVAEEDASSSDPRLPSSNRSYTYLYQGEAGSLLNPPYPVRTVIGASPVPAETEGLSVDGRISYYEDKNGVPWIASGDTDSAADIEAAWYYPLRSDFWHATAQIGDAVSLGALTGARPRNIAYNTVWPDDVAVLKAGETLTFSGGEYASDNNTATPQPQGLPTAAAWQAGKLVFDEANAALTPGDLGSSYLARVTPALESREVSLALTAVPTPLQPASGKVIVDGTLWRFKDLPASLQERVYYDTISQELGVRGLLNGRVLGDGDLLAAPGAQTILQPNVLTAEDEALVKLLSGDAAWVTVVGALANLSRDPEAGGGIGLEPALGGAKPANSFGPGLAVVTNPSLLKVGATGGYITVAENDHPDSPDTPVAIHIIRIDTEKYRGSVAVMEPSNVFDEKVTLRHTADFGGNVADLFFEWVIREEDGNPLDPPPTDGWMPFTSGLGKVDAQLAGTGATLITDNLVFCRYRHKDDPAGWSDWAGAANSYPPNDYVAQLAPGWIKRVAAAVNLFDARYSDFRSNDAPATYTSALQQAGQRHEGPVAFNPDKDAVENVGLIELYQTVLDRAEAFTIDGMVGTDGVNTALLNAANRIAGLYTLMGNEAYADALDPTVGFSTVSGQFGNLAPTIHAFQNQTANLLDEELTLLRGRDEPGARPAYNRLPWNFTNGAGEAAYVLNYGIEDLTEDGFLDDEDARRLYPQGHGDAWGHYTMALKGYYDLATTEHFTWSPRAEKYNIDGVVLDIDYMDERAFAKTAAAKAQCGAELVDLTYRQAYTENPDGQWQGYQDVDTDRAWGLFETAQRAGTGALYDWMLGNALLPAEDSAHTGIQRVDRSTVGELATIAAHAANIQTKLDAADRGLNPAGLDPNVVPFDIDPALVDRNHHTPATHFEQVLSRAKGAAANTLRIFDHASEAATLLRQTETSSESLRQQAIDQDRSYRNRLIEIFGTPYDGMIGSGKAYPAGYSGPDLYLFAYMDRLSVGADILDPLAPEIVETTIVPGLRNLAADSNPFTDTDLGVDDALRDTVSAYFPNDLTLPAAPVGNIVLDLPRAASSYALTAPSGWGQRSSPGAIQASIQELIQAEWQLRVAIDVYDDTADDFAALLRKFEVKSGIAASKIAITRRTVDGVDELRDAASDYFIAWNTLDHAREATLSTTGAIAEGIPSIVGLASDSLKPAVGISLAVGAAVDIALRAAIAPLQALQYDAELDAEQMQLEMEAALLVKDVKSELVDILDEILQLIHAEGDLQFPIITALEQMRAASDRVRTVVQEGQALIEERTVFNQRVAATTTKQRYEDYTFRVFQSEALRKYRSSFDLAARYAYLAGKAYQYELNLPDNHAANAGPLLAEMLRTRSLGEWQDGEPVMGNGGLADHLAILKTNFDTLKGQLGFNNPDSEVNAFSLRTELARVGLSSRVNADWRTQLENWRVPDLWNYEYQHNGVNYGYVFRRYCRAFAPEGAGAQPALVIPFDSTIKAGQNWFGNTLAGGDSAFNASSFSTKIRAAGVRFDGYNNTSLSQTPQVYFVPVGDDRMFLPDSRSLEYRSWNVVDQRIPAPIPISASNLSNPDWQPFTGSANGYFEEIRKYSSFRAYHDAGGWSDSEILQSGRLVGRSVWNTQWVLIIPNASLLSDPNNASAGIDTFIHGAPLPGYDQATAELTNRDRVGIRDIRILLQTYSISGN